jgi:hypothetical protein
MSETPLYTLKENIDEELHLFKSQKDTSGECLTKSISICKKMRYNEAIKTHFACQVNTSAQLESMKINRIICEVCKRHLYAE